MKHLFPLLMLAAGCSGPAVDDGPAAGSFTGAGRDRLCIAGEGESRRAGIVAYGAGDANCSATGAITTMADGYALVPQGEGACRIELSIEGETVEVTTVPEACAYYCAPGATLTGKQFRRDATSSPVKDFGNEALC